MLVIVLLVVYHITPLMVLGSLHIWQISLLCELGFMIPPRQLFTTCSRHFKEKFGKIGVRLMRVGGQIGAYLTLKSRILFSLNHVPVLFCLCSCYLVLYLWYFFVWVPSLSECLGSSPLWFVNICSVCGKKDVIVAYIHFLYVLVPTC